MDRQKSEGKNDFFTQRTNVAHNYDHYIKTIRIFFLNRCGQTTTLFPV